MSSCRSDVCNFSVASSQNITPHVAIVDAFPKKLEGEGMDYNHGSVFLRNARIDFDTGNDRFT